MSDRRLDIGDDEIRIIASAEKVVPAGKKRRRGAIVGIVAAVAAIAAIALLLLMTRSTDEPAAPMLEETVIEIQKPGAPDVSEQEAAVNAQPAAPAGYTARRDTTVNGTTLIILTPLNAKAQLAVGGDVHNDSTAVLMAQAADIRKDNGEIVGTFVLAGELISKGEAKGGYCSIVNGEMTLGVADATPMLEHALQTDGYFFRQYPLVAAGQLIENRPKGTSLRKALAEIDGSHAIITSTRPLSFHDFSQALIDAGVQNAIYLVGGNTETLYTDQEGNRHIIGRSIDQLPENVNYIVWH